VEGYSYDWELVGSTNACTKLKTVLQGHQIATCFDACTKLKTVLQGHQIATCFVISIQQQAQLLSSFKRSSITWKSGQNPINNLEKLKLFYSIFYIHVHVPKIIVFQPKSSSQVKRVCISYCIGSVETLQTFSSTSFLTIKVELLSVWHKPTWIATRDRGIHRVNIHG